jgi:hypothetical protein
MAQPGNTVCKILRRLTAAGVASTGKVLADFTGVGYTYPSGGPAASYTLSLAVAELANGYYAVTYLLPSAAGHFGVHITAASGTDSVEAVLFSGELEANDLDQMAALLARPVVGLTSSGTIGQQVALTLVNKRYRELTFSFVDANGTAVDMTTYTGITFGVRSKTDQTLTPPKIDAVNGTATAGSTYVITAAVGSITVKIPEDATFFTLTEGASPVDSLELEYELTGDQGGSATKTVSLVPTSPLTLTWREVGT